MATIFSTPDLSMRRGGTGPGSEPWYTDTIRWRGKYCASTWFRSRSLIAAGRAGRLRAGPRTTSGRGRRGYFEVGERPARRRTRSRCLRPGTSAASRGA